MAKHRIMDHTGHSTVEFDKANPAELRAAMERFNALIGTGHTPAVRKAGETDYKVPADKTFDPTADDTLFVPHYIGG